MNITHISAECYPIAKVGGLADVVGALPKYQNELGLKSSVIMPFYDNKFSKENEFVSICKSEVLLGVYDHKFEVLKLKKNILEFDVFFIDIPTLLFKDYVYSYEDTDRFLAFQIAALDWMLALEDKPNIIHCHDHHTGLVPFMLQESFKYTSLNKIPVITTIHNAQYQGWFAYNKLHLIPPFEMNNAGLLDWNGMINPLAAAIKCAWRVTTVSPSYMEELKIEANGLQDLLKQESQKCVGILNGIDIKVWNPETDVYIIENFSEKNVTLGRGKNKNWLCETFNLDKTKPLFAFIGRLVGEKGTDLLPEVFDTILKEKECNILLLGSGHNEVEEQLNALKEHHKGNYDAFIGYDEKLSHIIYAGADFLLMPSRVEPCGLNQMYSLRYGTIPIVRSTGGLKDTVIDIEDKNGFGICHNEVTVLQIEQAIKRGVSLYNNQERFKEIRKNIMKIDHSWDASAKEYIKLYNSIN
ncbi:glycogen synthase [Oceanihabitans sp. 2_MG-2023]|uniref:glycogen synthase n=1 Tax=Oceanihabitans sp. 2_MG-2023 TaxID=3062661 RepID=UPI0026E19D75|nr:glycogen synthase [Oceanihabitans sp. 2_MG-2023]MDO6597532.1 glycogen synthase [Oceanihabitans sp. 2_MG-2023]